MTKKPAATEDKPVTKKPATTEVKPTTTTTKKPAKATVKKPDVQVIENDKVKADSDSSPKREDNMPLAKPPKSKAKSFPGKKKKVKVCKVVAQPKPKCDKTEYGCCPDGVSPAKGPFEAGN